VAKKAVFGIAKSESRAIMIADQLKMAGFTNNDVSVLFPDKQGSKDFAHEQHTKAPEGAATGAAGGAILGGALGWSCRRTEPTTSILNTGERWIRPAERLRTG